MADRVIVAFDTERSRTHVKEMLEKEGIFPSVCCNSGAAARRAAAKLGGGVVVCGYRLPDTSAFELATSIHECSLILVVATTTQLAMYDGDIVFKLPSPVSRTDLAASVRMLLQMERRRVRENIPKRSEDDKQAIAAAKQLLIDRNYMTEEEAYRFLQKRSMDTGARLTDVAHEILQSSDEQIVDLFHV